MTKKERAKLRRQRRNRRIALIVAAFVLVAVFAIGGTIAWLTDATGDVENTFTAGDIDIDLEETTEDYKMVPGTEISKDPIVTVKAGSEACWLFVKVVESTDPALSKYIDYVVAEGWTAGQGDGEGKDGIPKNVYYRSVDAETAAAGENYVVIGYNKEDGEKTTFVPNMVLVKDTVTKVMMDAIKGDDAAKPTLTFMAYACQKAKFETAAAAWAEVQPAPVTPPATVE